MEGVKTKEITVTSSLTVNLGNYNSGRVEFSKTVTICDELVDESKLKEELWEEVNNEVDNQVAELQKAFKKN